MERTATMATALLWIGAQQGRFIILFQKHFIGESSHAFFY